MLVKVSILTNFLINIVIVNDFYAKLFNFKLSQYKSYGIKSHLSRDTQIANTHGCKENEEYWHSLGYSNIFFPFAIASLGVILALMSFVIEKLAHAAKHHYKKVLRNKVTSEANLKEDISSSEDYDSE